MTHSRIHQMYANHKLAKRMHYCGILFRCRGKAGTMYFLIIWFGVLMCPRS